MLADKRTHYSLTRIKDVINHQVRKKFDYPCDPYLSNYISAFDVNTYKLAYTFIRPDSVEDVTYTKAGDSLKSITRLYYDNPAYAYANRTVTKNSEGKTIESIRQFPHDLTALPTMPRALLQK
ncbi:hypothetical protein [Paraflavitalea speifideaquila]|uniref:hypothetical protein n=1 Tax=Paraflavitalea speifideaquila TaxID=3076558 RepID=UPI0028E34952|nr:hypothetical protein [Paraflavitalea speifideiaquila]